MAETNFEDEDLDYREVVEEVLENHDLRYHSKVNDNKVFFSLSFNAKNLPSLDLFLTVTTKGDAKITCYLVRDIVPQKRAAVINAINNLNNSYRYITLSLDSDGDLLAQYDFTIFGDEEVADKQVITMIFLVREIMDECFPKIMKAIWRDDDE